MGERRDRRVLAWAIFGVCVVLLLGVLLFVRNLRAAAHREYEAARQRLLSEAKPEGSPEPPSWDATDEINAALALYSGPANKDERDVLDSLTHSRRLDLSLRKATLPGARALLEKNAKFEDAMRAVARRPRGTLRPEASIRTFQQLQDSLRIFAVQAEVDLAEGRGSAAALDVADLEGLSSVLDRQGTIPGFAYRLALEDHAETAFLHFAQGAVPGASEIDMLDEAVRSSDNAGLLGRTLEAERRTLADKVDKSWEASYEGTGFPARPLFDRLLGTARDRDRAAFLELVRRTFELPDLPPDLCADRVAETQAWAEKLPESCRKARSWAVRADQYWRFGALEAQTRGGTKILLALMRFRAAHGAFPSSLDELALPGSPALPLDPWTGKPFQYKQKGDSARLWCTPPWAPAPHDSERADSERGDPSAWTLGDPSPFLTPSPNPPGQPR